jgi:hypothetical protein
LLPLGTSCVRGTTALMVAGAAPAKIRRVVFFNGKRKVATIRRGTLGLYVAPWQTKFARRGVHTLRVVLESRSGSVEATRHVRICR